MHRTKHLKIGQKPGTVSKKENRVNLFQKMAIGFLILLTLCLTPVAAVPSNDLQLPETWWNYAPETVDTSITKQSILELPYNNIVQPSSASREFKLRATQNKNEGFFTEYQADISETGDVFFVDSPVITGLHLPDGMSGNVYLTTNIETDLAGFQETYNVFEIFVNDYPSGSETVIQYTIPLSEIEDKGYSPADIALFCCIDGDWEKLATEYYMDDENAYFESITTALGIFAIVLEETSIDIGSVSIRMGDVSPVALEISPACILTHPVSYTAVAE